MTKGVRFQNNIELGDPVEMAVAYSDGGCDELVFLRYHRVGGAQADRYRDGERKWPG